MKPINEIRALFNVIKTETRRWFNTGARIDEVGQEVLNHIEYLEQQFPLELSHNALSDKNGEDKFRHVDLLYTKQTLLENDKLVVWDSNTNEVILARKSSISHRDISYKNGELKFQHINTTTIKENLVEDDKVPIYDSETGNVVLTDKTNVGYRITDIISTTGVWSSSKTIEEINKLLPLIYAGL